MSAFRLEAEVRIARSETYRTTPSSRRLNRLYYSQLIFDFAEKSIKKPVDRSHCHSEKVRELFVMAFSLNGRNTPEMDQSAYSYTYSQNFVFFLGILLKLLDKIDIFFCGFKESLFLESDLIRYTQQCLVRNKIYVHCVRDGG
jgi:hypothetical protein